jgi:hypothetical protein
MYNLLTKVLEMKTRMVGSPLRLCCILTCILSDIYPEVGITESYASSNFGGASTLFSTAVALIYIPTKRVQASPCLIQHLLLCALLMIGMLHGVRWNLKVILICLPFCRPHLLKVPPPPMATQAVDQAFNTPPLGHIPETLRGQGIWWFQSLIYQVPHPQDQHGVDEQCLQATQLCDLNMRKSIFFVSIYEMMNEEWNLLKLFQSEGRELWRG